MAEWLNLAGVGQYTERQERRVYGSGVQRALGMLLIGLMERRRFGDIGSNHPKEGRGRM